MAKRELTAAEIAAAKRLKKAWLAAKAEDKSLTQDEVASRMNWSGQSAFSQYVNCAIPLNWAVLVKLCAIFGVNPGDIFPEMAAEYDNVLMPVKAWGDRDELPDSDYAMIKMLSVELAAGDGNDSGEYTKTTMPFSRHTLRRLGVDESSCYMVGVIGDSMERRLYNGDVVLVDTKQRKPREGWCFAILDDDLQRVKYLEPLPGGGLRIRSENREDYPDVDLTAEQWKGRVTIRGRVVWSASLGW